MKPATPKRALLLAALLSAASHWLVLRGFDNVLPSPAGSPSTSVMVAALPAPVTPAVRPAAKPVSPPQKTASRPPADTAVSTEASPHKPEKPETAEPETADRVDAPAPSPAAELPKNLSGQLPFDVFLGDGDGEALARLTHTLRISDGHYELTSRGEALGLLALLYSGLLTQQSNGDWDDAGFNSRQYTEQRGRKPETRATVDMATQLVRFSHGGTAPLPSPAVQDRLSAIYQLALLVRGQGAPASVELQVLSSSALEAWRFVRVGMEPLRQGDMSVETVHYRRQQQEGAEKTGIDLWFELAADGWPVQIRLTDRKGTVITQRRAALRTSASGDQPVSAPSRAP